MNKSKSKIFDCVTFFDENLLVNARLEILKDVVDYFIICESNYDYRGYKKKINFRLINKKFKNRVRHLILKDKFPDPKNLWKSEELQREMIFEGIKDANSDDFIMYSDSDEIPNPEVLKKIKLNTKYALLLMNMYVYKIFFLKNEKLFKSFFLQILVPSHGDSYLLSKFIL